MKKYIIAITLLGFPFLVAARSVTVERVIDGDTFVTTDSEHIRLIGIDTPEVSSDDCYAEKAKTYLESLILGEVVDLKFDEDKYDRYDRTLAYVNFNGSINKKLLSKGYAFAYTVSPNDKYEDKYLAAQTDAQKAGKGIWSHCDNIIKEYKPSKVTGLMVSDITETSATLSWSEVDLARSYKVTVTPSGGSPINYTGIKDSTYQLTNLIANTSYSVTVKAKNYLGYGKTSSAESLSTSTTTEEEEDQSSDIICSSNVYNCTDFSTQADAQEVYDYCFIQVGTDIHELDSDDDGEACESLD